VLYRAPEGVHLYGLALRGEQLVTAGSDGLVRVHDAEGEVHQTLDLEGIVYSVAVDDEGNILAGGHKGKLARWSADGTLDWRGDAEFTITSVAPGPDGFLVCRGRESAQIWSTEPALVRTLSDVGTWDCNWAEGDPLTSGVHPQNADSSLERWTATGPKTLLTQQGWLYRASVRGQRVAQSTQRGELVVVNIDGTELHRIQAHEGAALEAIWLDDHTVMTGGFDRQARIWDLRTETALRALPHEGMVNEAAWDADARVLYTVSDDGTLRVWPLSY
jgi:WD40 repeat protein